MKIVYTYIFGKHDWLRPPKHVTQGWRYVCFTDTPDGVWPPNAQKRAWEIIYKPSDQDNPKRTAGYYLTHSTDLFPEAEIIISAIGMCQVVGDLDSFVRTNLTQDYCLMRHPARVCTYSEGQACISYKKDTPENINPQMDRYKAEGLPKNHGMVQTGVIGRRNTVGVKEFERLWWEEIKNESKRDQLSFNYTLWKHPGLIKVDTFDPNHLGKWFMLCPHRK